MLIRDNCDDSCHEPTKILDQIYSCTSGGFSPNHLGCTVRMRSAVNVGRAGAKSAVNSTEVSIKCRDCQRGDSRRFGTFLT